MSITNTSELVKLARAEGFRAGIEAAAKLMQSKYTAQMLATSSLPKHLVLRGEGMEHAYRIAETSIRAILPADEEVK
jgi:hypothetical protein